MSDILACEIFFKSIKCHTFLESQAWPNLNDEDDVDDDDNDDDNNDKEQKEEEDNEIFFISIKCHTFRNHKLALI